MNIFIDTTLKIISVKITGKKAFETGRIVLLKQGGWGAIHVSCVLYENGFFLIYKEPRSV